MKTQILLSIVTFVIFSGCSTVLAERPTEQELKFVQILNAERIAKGFGIVELDLELSAGCRRWSKRLRAGHWGHARNFDGGVNENIARGSARAEDAFRQWKFSRKGHYGNMMNPRITKIGVACEGTYWTFRGGVKK